MIKVKFIPKYFPIVLLQLDSVVENKTFRKTLNGKDIKVSRMRKTNTRLNKWDMAKIKKHRN